MTITVVGVQTAPSSHTGDTFETVLGTIQVPANTFPADGVLDIRPFASRNGTSLSPVTLRARLDGLAGPVVASGTLGTSNNIAMQGKAQVWADNSTTAQKTTNGNPFASPYTGGTGGLIRTNVDFSNNVDVVITAQLGNAADNVTLEGFQLQLIEP